MEPETRLAIDTAVQWMDSELKAGAVPLEMRNEVEYTKDQIEAIIDCPKCKRCDDRRKAIAGIGAIVAYTAGVVLVTVIITIVAIGIL